MSGLTRGPSGPVPASERRRSPTTLASMLLPVAAALPASSGAPIAGLGDYSLATTGSGGEGGSGGGGGRASSSTGGGGSGTGGATVSSGTGGHGGKGGSGGGDGGPWPAIAELALGTEYAC